MQQFNSEEASRISNVSDDSVEEINEIQSRNYADCLEYYADRPKRKDSSPRSGEDKERHRDRRGKRSRSSSRRSRSRSRSRNRERDRDREDRSRSPRVVYDYHHRSYNRRSRSRSRSRSYDRDRRRDDYYYGNRRSPHSDDEYSGDYNYRYRPSDRRCDAQPSSTIVIKGLPPIVDEVLMWDIISRHGFVPKDVRILKKKETGQSRGFGFVEFNDVEEAKRWMEYTQGRVNIDDRHSADLEYSVNRSSSMGMTNSNSAISLAAAAAAQLRGGDWICTKCGTNNFKKRDNCFKCNIKRDESDALGGEGFNEIGVMPGDTLLLRNVPPTADEEHILYCLKKLCALEIRRVVVSRCPETGYSRGYAYIELNSITEAAQLLTTLTAVTKLNIDGREILVSYSKLPLTSLLAGSAGSSSEKDDIWSNHLAYSVGNSRGMAVNTTAGGMMQTDVTNAAAAVAQSAIKKAQVMRHVAAQHVQAQMHVAATTAHLLMPGAALLLQQHQHILAAQALQEMAAVQLLQEQAAAVSMQQQQQAAAAAAAAPSLNLGTVHTPYGELPKYPFPDTSVYQYEATSGFYFDPTTGLYYDGKTQYYYNSETQQYLYWDSSYQTYLPAPTSSETSSTTTDESATKDGADKKEPADKSDKVKTAKKIQKDMEKWAKQLNQKKETKSNVVQPGASQTIAPVEQKQSATADVAFSALEKKVAVKLTPGLVSYEGGDSDDESSVPMSSQKMFSQSTNQLDEKTVVDWEKLACLLCRRQFPSKDVLVKHQQFSDLHKKNVEEKLRSLKASSGEESLDSTRRSGFELNFGSSAGSQYRDRAKERREKFGLDDKPQPNRLKEKYLESISDPTETPTVSGLKSDNIGNKLLKSMGWQEGQGLGRANQGIVDPITQQRRAQGAGLGSTNAVVDAPPSGTYKDHVRAALRQKFFEQS